MTVPDVVAAKQWLDDFARASESSETLDYLVQVVDDRIVQALPEFLDPTLRAELHASTRAHWKGFLAVVTRDSIEVQPGPQIFDLARTLARRGFELPLLLSVYRIGQRALWHFITDMLQTQISDPALRSTVLLQFWSHAAHWLDTSIETLIVSFTQEREQWQRGAQARRTAIVDTILAGKPVDLETAATTLAYPLRHCHTAFTLAVDETVPESDVQPLIESAARAVSAALNGGRPLMISSGARAAWCWTATPQIASPVRAPALPPSVTGTAGICHSGLDGFRLSHSEAIAALTVAADSTPGFVNFQDVEIACLAAGIVDEEARAAFVRRQLRDLADSDETTERLRDTLRVYLQQGGDATAAGERLNLHPNTVRYRIRQAEKKLGHPITQQRVHIELALEIITVLGDQPMSTHNKPGLFCPSRH